MSNWQSINLACHPKYSWATSPFYSLGNYHQKSDYEHFFKFDHNQAIEAQHVVAAYLELVPVKRFRHATDGVALSILLTLFTALSHDFNSHTINLIPETASIGISLFSFYGFLTIPLKGDKFGQGRLIYRQYSM